MVTKKHLHNADAFDKRYFDFNLFYQFFKVVIEYFLFI